MAAGKDHTCAIIIGGTMKCWGLNFSGQLGDGGQQAAPRVPVEVKDLAGVTRITMGQDFTCAIAGDGDAYCWGYNAFGSVGDGTLVNRFTPVPIPGLTGVSDISAGRFHACAVVEAGAVKCWGVNNGGQLGDGTSIDRLSPVAVTMGVSTPLTGIASLSAGRTHVCALSIDAVALCWGSNLDFQLGDRQASTRLPPDLVPRQSAP